MWLLTASWPAGVSVLRSPPSRTRPPVPVSWMSQRLDAVAGAAGDADAQLAHVADFAGLDAIVACRR